MTLKAIFESSWEITILHLLLVFPVLFDQFVWLILKNY